MGQYFLILINNKQMLIYLCLLCRMMEMRVARSVAPTVERTGRPAAPMLNLATTHAWSLCLQYVDLHLPAVHLNVLCARFFW